MRTAKLQEILKLQSLDYRDYKVSRDLGWTISPVLGQVRVDNFTRVRVDNFTRNNLAFA